MLVTTLTKKMSEDLTEYLAQQGLKVRYMHSDIEAIERQVIIRDLRLGHFDVLIGINLLREAFGLAGSLAGGDFGRRQDRLFAERAQPHPDHRPRGAQRAGRGVSVRRRDERRDAGRHRRNRPPRREKQVAYNSAHGITPETIQKTIRQVIRGEKEGEDTAQLDPWERELVMDDLKGELATLETEMWAASEALDFERAAAVRDRIREVEAQLQGKEVKMSDAAGEKAQSGGAAVGKPKSSQDSGVGSQRKFGATEF